MSHFLSTFAAFLLALGLLVVVHELGHYLVARACGVKVLAFSFGFGPRLWSRRFGADQTEWIIAALPLGGYVRMLDEREGEVAASELPRAFNRQLPWRRVAVVVAGPLANFLLAIVLYWGVFVHGVEEPRALLGAPPAASAAAMAGVTAGERVDKVGGTPIETWSDLHWQLLSQSQDRDSVDLEVIDADFHVAIRRLDLAVAHASGWEGDTLSLLGLVPGRPKLAPIIGEVRADSAAASAGLQVGDRVLAVAGVPLDDWADFVRTIRAAPGQTLSIELSRAGQRVSLTVAVDGDEIKGQRIGRIGVTVRADDRDRDAWLTTVRYPPLAALGHAIGETWDKSVFSLVMMGRMISGDVSWRNLSGPVSIASYAGQSAQLGADYYARFLALLSLSLGVLNLLPIPILDGGHLLYYLAEIIRRAPLSERAMEIGQRFGMALLLTLMVFAFYNDFSRLVSG